MVKNGLENHFLQNFLYSQEPFAVIGSRLYTLSRTNGHFNGHDSFHFIGRAYSLDEAEEISQLEKGLFIAKRSEIEQTMSQQIHAKEDKVKQTKTELQKMQNVYASIQDSTVERFIMVDVFNAYNHENREGVNKSAQSGKSDDIPKVEKMPGVYDLVSRKNSLDPLIDSFGFISISGKSYALYKNGGKKDENQGYVIFGQHVLDLKPWIALEELCKKYTENLVKRIQEKAEEHGKEFAPLLEKMSKEKRELDEVIKQKKSISGKTSDRRGEIGFRKIKDDEYEVSVTVPPFIIEKDGMYYAFGAVRLGTTIQAKNNRVMINNKPRVLNMPYLHPFVWPDSEVCYGEFKWKTQRGVSFNHWYSLESRKAVAKIVAEVIKEGKKTMERGYVGKVKPVHLIEECNCIANNRRDAENYARAHGIKLERIIKND